MQTYFEFVSASGDASSFKPRHDAFRFSSSSDGRGVKQNVLPLG